MVLDEASLPSSDFTSYDAPNPDAPPPDTPDQTPINFSELPSSMPVFGPIFGFTEQRLAELVKSRQGGAKLILKRSLTPDESQALAYWSAKFVAVMSWGGPLGGGAGLYRAYATRQTFRFPFIAPKPESFNPTKVKLGPLEILQGVRAVYFWHGLRGAAYMYIGNWIGKGILATYAASITTVGQSRDPRLRDLTTRMYEEARERLKPVGRDPTGQGNKSASDLWKNHRGSIGARDADDASPSAGSADETSDDTKLSYGHDGMLSDEQRTAQDFRQQAPMPNRRDPTKASTFRIERVERQPSTFDSDPDSESNSSNPTANPPTSTGSAWDRVRASATNSSSSSQKPSRPKRRPGRHPDEEDTGDSFSFSDADEERQLARDEAQQDFDARVEKERRGGDFSGNRNGNGEREGGRRKGW